MTRHQNSAAVLVHALQFEVAKPASDGANLKVNALKDRDDTDDEGEEKGTETKDQHHNTKKETMEDRNNCGKLGHLQRDCQCRVNLSKHEGSEQ